MMRFLRHIIFADVQFSRGYCHVRKSGPAGPIGLPENLILFLSLSSLLSRGFVIPAAEISA